MSIEQAIQADYVAAAQNAGLLLYDYPPAADGPATFARLDYIEARNQQACLYDVEVLINVFSRKDSKADLFEYITKLQNVIRTVRPSWAGERVVIADVERRRFSRTQENDGYNWHQCTLIIILKVERCGKDK